MSKKQEYGHSGFSRRGFLGLLGAGTMPVLFAPIRAGIAQRGATWQIALIESLSGPFAFLNQTSWQGAALAANEVNGQGGIEGRDLEIVIYDLGQQSPQTAAILTKRARAEGAIAVITPFASVSASSTIAEVAEADRLPAFIANPFAEELFERPSMFRFRIPSGARAVAQRSVSFIAELAEETGTPLQSVGLIQEDSPVWQLVAEVLRSSAMEYGYEVTIEYGYGFQQPQFDDAVRQLKERETDVVFHLGNPWSGQRLVESIRARRADVKAVIGTFAPGYSNPTAINQRPELLLNTMDVNYWWNPQRSEIETFKDLFLQAGEHPLSNNGLHAYLTVTLLAEAMRMADPRDPDDLANALREIEYSEHLLAQEGPIRFDERGQNVNSELVLVQVQNPKPIIILPPPYAEGKAKTGGFAE